MYFKETQTPEDQWNVGPDEQANSEETISNGAGKCFQVSIRHQQSVIELTNLILFPVPGQVHFFPAIANTKDLIKGFEKHGRAKIE